MDRRSLLYQAGCRVYVLRNPPILQSSIRRELAKFVLPNFPEQDYCIISRPQTLTLSVGDRALSNLGDIILDINEVLTRRDIV